MIAFDCVKDLGFVMRILTYVTHYLRILIPLVLIVLIVFDLAKFVMGQVDEKAKKDVMSTIVKRLMYAIIIFFVPVIISYILNNLSGLNEEDIKGKPTTWVGCWNYYYEQVNK